jgi:hypothetical protein
MMYGNFKAYPYDSRYEVSDQGWIRNTRTGYTTKGHKNSRGYYKFSLKKNIVRFVHDMVLETFVGPRPEGCQCDHINTLRDDNRLENLRWVSCEENNLNPLTVNKRCKAVYQFTLDGEFVAEYHSTYTAAKETGFARPPISKACNNPSYTYRGYKWMFKDEFYKKWTYVR